MPEEVKLVPGYDWKQTAKKVGKSAGIACGAAILALFADPTFRDSLVVGAPKEVATAFLIIQALAVALLDAYKHRND